MSGWAYNWFAGRSGARRSDAPKKAILGLREQLEMLSKREKHLESQINDQDALARKHVSGNKTGECRPVHVRIATGTRPGDDTNGLPSGQGCLAAQETV